MEQKIFFFTIDSTFVMNQPGPARPVRIQVRSGTKKAALHSLHVGDASLERSDKEFLVTLNRIFFFVKSIFHLTCYHEHVSIFFSPQRGEEDASSTLTSFLIRTNGITVQFGQWVPSSEESCRSDEHSCSRHNHPWEADLAIMFGATCSHP